MLLHVMLSLVNHVSIVPVSNGEFTVSMVMALANTPLAMIYYG